MLLLILLENVIKKILISNVVTKRFINTNAVTKNGIKMDQIKEKLKNIFQL